MLLPTEQRGNSVAVSTICDEHGWARDDNSLGTTLAVARTGNLKFVSLRWIDLGEGAGNQNIIDLEADQIALLVAHRPRDEGGQADHELAALQDVVDDALRRGLAREST